MKARGLALLLAGSVGVLALALLMLPGAAAAPAAPSHVTALSVPGPACLIHVQMIVPTYVHLGQVFGVQTIVIVSGNTPACHAFGLTYNYLGFPGPTPPSIPSFSYAIYTPGTYHVAVLVHGSFGTVVVPALLAVGE
jgi:hypothetical protein